MEDYSRNVFKMFFVLVERTGMLGEGGGGWGGCFFIVMIRGTVIAFDAWHSADFLLSKNLVEYDIDIRMYREKTKCFTTHDGTRITQNGLTGRYTSACKHDFDTLGVTMAKVKVCYH
jgi:hypothetical protein